MRHLLFKGMCIVVIALIGCRKKVPTGGLELPNSDSLRQIPFIDFPKSAFLMNDSIDLEPRLPPSGDQFKQGACAPFVLGYTIISYYEKKMRGYEFRLPSGEIDQHKIYSPSFIFNALKNRAVDCKSGVSYSSSMVFIQNNGICTWREYPYHGDLYSCMSPPGAAQYRKARLKLGYKFYRVPNTIESIKSLLNQDFPVILALFTSKNFVDDGYAHTDKPFTWNPAKNDIHLYHALVCVGYNDKTGMFKLVNSWSPDWANRGYFYVPYRALVSRIKELYVASFEGSVTDHGFSKGQQLKIEQMNLRQSNVFINTQPIHSEIEEKSRLRRLFIDEYEILSSKTSRSAEEEKILTELKRRYEY